MAEEKMVDFLRAVIDAEPDFHAPNVAPVRMQVRTGGSVPAKKDMMEQNHVVLIWSYQVQDVNAFRNFLQQKEADFTKLFDNFLTPQGGKVKRRLTYNGTYPVHDKAGAMKSLFGGERDLVAMLEKARTQGPNAMANQTEKDIALGIKSILGFAQGAVTSETLDPAV